MTRDEASRFVKRDEIAKMRELFAGARRHEQNSPVVLLLLDSIEQERNALDVQRELSGGLAEAVDKLAAQNEQLEKELAGAQERAHDAFMQAFVGVPLRERDRYQQLEADLKQFQSALEEERKISTSLRKTVDLLSKTIEKKDDEKEALKGRLCSAFAEISEHVRRTGEARANFQRAAARFDEATEELADEREFSRAAHLRLLELEAKIQGMRDGAGHLRAQLGAERSAAGAALGFLREEATRQLETVERIAGPR